MPSEIDRLIREYRRRIAASEAEAINELLEEYERLRQRLLAEVRKLETEIEAARQSGKPISKATINRDRRLRQLLDAIDREIRRFGRQAASIIESRQREAVTIAASESRRLVQIRGGEAESIGSFFPGRAFETSVGMLGDGSPLLDYFNETLSPAVSAKIREVLLDGIARGLNSRDIGRAIMKAGDITKRRAMTTARTEIGRANREAARSIYIESEIVEAWEWVASKSPRTCPACLALDGTIFKVTIPFPQHHNCRCTIIPVIEGIGRLRRTLGREWLASQPKEIQEQVLGKSGAEAYQSGDVKLDDFVGWANDARFGKRVYTRPIGTIFISGPPRTGRE